MNNLPEHRPARNLRPLPAKPHVWRPPTQQELQYQSLQLLKILRGFKVGGLERFFNLALADTGVVQAYFEPRLINMGSDRSAGQLAVVPVNESLRAASQASRFDILPPHERGLAKVAAFLHAAGLYFITSSMRSDHRMQSEVSAHCAREHNRVWLEDALRALRADIPALGATLTAGMEMGDFGGCDPEQVARIITARRLANLGIEELWLPSGK